MRRLDPSESESSNLLVCAECGAVSPPDAEGWRTYLDDDDQAVTFGPKCAKREFGGRSEP